MFITKRRLAVLAAVPALALSAACGAQSFASTSSSVPSAATATAAAAKPSWHETAVKFAGCMRENGIDIPDPVKGQDLDTSAVTKVTQAKLDAAMKACKEWDSAILGGSEPSSPEDEAKFAAWAQCLRKGGVWQPIGKDETRPAGFKGVKPGSAAEKQVFEGCDSLRPPAPYEEN
ncbi:hypothetical protein ACFFV7_21715 [Nonomuraea spiralis]|uniref:Lipoprotein n=1 Tax=Nonomuraea spiralis TaxID=46182 RepID=A0ABV5IH03_9ACTN|nr:hypothetical protein [Nonomuraea spiralis]GGS97411.1 hypothetical protein GCM10010176_046580 [Nonomuraea spiralis]